MIVIAPTFPEAFMQDTRTAFVAIMALSLLLGASAPPPALCMDVSDSPFAGMPDNLLDDAEVDAPP